MSIQSLPTASSVSLAAVFEARCWARARLFAEGELDLHDAVDKLQADADRDGFSAAIGQDAVQAMMGDAFGAVRERTNELATASAWEFGEAYADHRGVLDPATVDEFDRLIERDDPVPFRKWMTRLTVAERMAVRGLVTAWA
jgi:acyl-CoA reductase-like NAD-dependent aldehyde dehydrogenase